MPTPDAARRQHVLMLRLEPHGDTLSGCVSAAAMNGTYWLPYWTELVRKHNSSGVRSMTCCAPALVADSRPPLVRSGHLEIAAHPGKGSGPHEQEQDP